MRLPIANVFGWKATTRRPDVAVTSGWTLRVVDVSRESFDNLNMCHHLFEGQNLTTTYIH